MCLDKWFFLYFTSIFAKSRSLYLKPYYSNKYNFVVLVYLKVKWGLWLYEFYSVSNTSYWKSSFRFFTEKKVDELPKKSICLCAILWVYKLIKLSSCGFLGVVHNLFNGILCNGGLLLSICILWICFVHDHSYSISKQEYGVGVYGLNTLKRAS